MAGFNILAVTENGDIKLNGELIPSTMIDSVEPTDYAFSVVTEATSFVRQEVEISNALNDFGPFVLGEPQGSYINPYGIEMTPVLWLPMLIQ